MINLMITVIGILVMILLWVMLYDSNRFVVVHRSFADPRIRRKCRAVILADLHNKRYGRDNERLIAAIREQKPDVILVAGDILTAKPGRTPDIAVRLLEELARDYPIYYGNGNHEQRLLLYPRSYGDMGEVYDRELQRIGVHRLINAHTVLEDCGIAVFGLEIDRVYYKRFRVAPMEQEYLEKTLGRPVEGCYNILLAHNPDYFPQYAGWGVDLVLSGHVHGGVVRIPFLGKGVLSPAVRLFPKYDGGIFRQDKSVMWLSRGLGMHTIPIRLFNPGELLVADLEPEEGR